MQKSSLRDVFKADLKTIRKAYVKKFSVLVYLTEGYESIRNKIDHLCSL